MIYLDHNATTPVREEVREAVGRALGELVGNPSSVHAAGRAARVAVEQARSEVAALVGASAEEMVFCSGGTEGDNWAIRFLSRLGGPARRHLVSSRLEHPAVRETLEALEREGFTVSWVTPSAEGTLAVADVAGAVRDDTALVTLAAVNHELGNVHPVAAFAEVAHARGALFHSDCVQAAGKIPLDVHGAGLDAATLSSHKINGPKGVGAVYVSRKLDPDPLIVGGHQERERRAGTENLPGIVGFGVASRLAREELEGEAARLLPLRDLLEQALLAMPGARRHGPGPAMPRSAGTLNVGFDGVPGQLLTINLDLAGICASTGAACTSGSLHPSPVLLALGLSEEAAAEAVRFSLGRGNTRDEIVQVIDLIPSLLTRVRAARARGRDTTSRRSEVP